MDPTPARLGGEPPSSTTGATAGHSRGALEEQVATEQVRLIYSQLPVAIGGTLAAALILVIALWSVMPASWLCAWLIAMTANQLWRLALYRRFRHEGVPAAASRRLGTIWTAGAVVSGVLWGSAAAVFFVPDSVLHQLLLLVLLFAMIGTGVALLAPHAPSFFAFFIPTVVPIIVRNALEGDPPHFAVALITFIMTLAIVGVGRRNHAMILESLRNRFRNLELVEELRARNAELTRSRQLAEQASRAKTQFFAAASHDLRQPLHAMGLFAAALAERVRDPEVLDVVGSINASVAALEQLFNELLDISKIDAGAIKPKFTAFPLGSLLERVAKDIEPTARAKGLTVRCRGTRLIAQSDPILVERILRNLLSNAQRYTERGGMLLAARRRGERVSVEVWDTGIGIAPDQQERIFEEFVQIGNPARTAKRGMGLGLAIVRRLCALLATHVDLSSRPGKGSVFRFDLALGPAPRLSIASTSPPQPERAQSLAGFTVVVIDDEEAIVQGMRVLLEGWGAKVVCATSLADAQLQLAGCSRPPDLVVSDLHLPQGENGFDAVDSLRAKYGPELGAIVVSGSASPQHTERARLNGSHFLLKPVNPGKLRMLVHFSLRRARHHAVH